VDALKSFWLAQVNASSSQTNTLQPWLIFNGGRSLYSWKNGIFALPFETHKTRS
jgi:hypothetical protein